MKHTTLSLHWKQLYLHGALKMESIFVLFGWGGQSDYLGSTWITLEVYHWLPNENISNVNQWQYLQCSTIDNYRICLDWDTDVLKSAWIVNYRVCFFLFLFAIYYHRNKGVLVLSSLPRVWSLGFPVSDYKVTAMYFFCVIISYLASAHVKTSTQMQ